VVAGSGVISRTEAGGLLAFEITAAGEILTQRPEPTHVTDNHSNSSVSRYLPRSFILSSSGWTWEIVEVGRAYSNRRPLPPIMSGAGTGRVPGRGAQAVSGLGPVALTLIFMTFCNRSNQNGAPSETENPVTSQPKIG
jgi:hypothetical protein